MAKLDFDGLSYFWSKGKTYISNLLKGKADSSHTHDDRYYLSLIHIYNDFSVEYKRNGRILTGYKAEILPRICDIYLSARDDDVLTENQKPLAIASEDVYKRQFL